MRCGRAFLKDGVDDLMGSMFGEAETGAYVIDDEYRLVYFNKTLERMFPGLRLGMFCYRELCGGPTPCDGCPLHTMRAGKTLLYNHVVQAWVEVEIDDIEWPGVGMYHLVLSRVLEESDKGPLFSLASSSIYDELFELNLGANSYRILYHVEGKYVTPDREGALDAMIADVALNMIHPDDQTLFNEFWNLGTMRSRFAQDAVRGKDGGVLRGRFRKKKSDGSWSWVVQTVVVLPHNPGEDEILLCFIQDVDEEMTGERPALLSTASVTLLDELTGLRTRMSFLSEAADLVVGHPQERYCLMAIDIEHFKLFNEWHGEKAGDALLKEMASSLARAEADCGAVAGYLLGDDFCIVLPHSHDIIQALQDDLTERVRAHGKEMAFLPAFGLYAIDDPSVPVSTMYDRALLALASVKGNYAQRSCWYEADMIQGMEKDHVLLSEVQRAFSEGEFTFYAQPKCNMSTGKIVGLESLARWEHPERGLIAPDRFIPLLERNGLITALDVCIWERVCQALRAWIEAGRKAIPISVNMSRRDVYAIDVVETLKGLTDRYAIDPRLLSIEITESSYVEDYEMISSIVDDLRAAGFAVHMDDFGSGYSSLSMLKDLNVDVLKLDMKLLDVGSEHAFKGRSILESIINMARLVDLRVVAEGVETVEQRDFLLKAGCLYAQGYYYYKPMPPEKFEPLLADPDNVDFRGIKADPIERLQTRQLLNDSVLSNTMMDDILGAIAFYDVHDGRAEIVSANERYCRLTGISAIDLEERRERITRLVYESDQPAFMDVFERAYRQAPEGAEVEVRRAKPDGGMVYVHFRTFFLRENDGHRFYYGALTDVTEQRRQAMQLESSQRALSAVLGVSASDGAFMALAEENRRTASAIFAQMSPVGMIGGYCQEGFPLYFANAAMAELLGYGSYDELAEAIEWRVENTIHPDDRASVHGDIGSVYYPGLEYTTTYRMIRKDGTWFWTLDKGRVVEAEDGRLAIVSACADVSEVMAAQHRLAERNELLLNRNRELTLLNEDMPDGYHRCLDTPDYDFLYMSDRFAGMFGYTREQIKELFDDKFMNMIHPEDRTLVAEGVAAMREGRSDELSTLEYRMKSIDGYRRVVDQSRYLEYEGRLFLQGVVIDITDAAGLRDA